MLEQYQKSLKRYSIRHLSIVSLFAGLSLFVGRQVNSGAQQTVQVSLRETASVVITLQGPSHFKAQDALGTNYYVNFKNTGQHHVIVSTYEVFLIVYDSQGKVISDVQYERSAPNEKKSLPSLFDLEVLRIGDSFQTNRTVCRKFIGHPPPGNYFLECRIYHLPKSAYKSTLTPLASSGEAFPLVQSDLHSSPRLPIHLD